MDDAEAKKLNRKLRNAALARQDRIAKYTRDMMASRDGRLWMGWLLGEVCHIERMSFTGNALTSAFADGERNVGLQIKSQIESQSPEHFLTMLREYHEETNVRPATDDPE